MSLTDKQKSLVLDIASQLRLAIKNKTKLKCGKGDLNLSTGLATFKCSLPITAFAAIYHLINDNDTSK